MPDRWLPHLVPSTDKSSSTSPETPKNKSRQPRSFCGGTKVGRVSQRRCYLLWSNNYWSTQVTFFNQLTKRIPLNAGSGVSSFCSFDRKRHVQFLVPLVSRASDRNFTRGHKNRHRPPQPVVDSGLGDTWQRWNGNHLMMSWYSANRYKTFSSSLGRGYRGTQGYIPETTAWLT